MFQDQVMKRRDSSLQPDGLGQFRAKDVKEKDTKSKVVLGLDGRANCKSRQIKTDGGFGGGQCHLTMPTREGAMGRRPIFVASR